MTESEKQTIIDAVISAIRTNSQTIEQLSPVSSLAEEDYFEISGGRKVSYKTLSSLIASLPEEKINGLLVEIKKLSQSAGDALDFVNPLRLQYNNDAVSFTGDFNQGYENAKNALKKATDAELTGLSFSGGAANAVLRVTSVGKTLTANVPAAALSSWGLMTPQHVKDLADAKSAAEGAVPKRSAEDTSVASDKSVSVSAGKNVELRAGNKIILTSSDDIDMSAQDVAIRAKGTKNDDDSLGHGKVVVENTDDAEYGGTPSAAVTMRSKSSVAMEAKGRASVSGSSVDVACPNGCTFTIGAYELHSVGEIRLISGSKAELISSGSVNVSAATKVALSAPRVDVDLSNGVRAVYAKESGEDAAEIKIKAKAGRSVTVDPDGTTVDGPIYGMASPKQRGSLPESISDVDLSKLADARIEKVSDQIIFELPLVEDPTLRRFCKEADKFDSATPELPSMMFDRHIDFGRAALAACIALAKEIRTIKNAALTSAEIEQAWNEAAEASTPADQPETSQS